MKNYLALDCGGSKVAAILYDESFAPRGVCVTGSVRENTTDPGPVAEHIRAVIETLGLPGLTVEEYGGSCSANLVEAIGKVCVLKRRGISGELDMGLAAAGIFGDGILAVCGTGAAVFARKGDLTFAAGGYGAAVADEGSGYYIGRAGMIAAIRASEGRGEPTALAEMLPVHFGYAGAKEIRQAFFSVYGGAGISPAAAVARCAPVVARAAAAGDPPARAILTEAGRLLGEQTRFLVEANALPGNMRLTVSGSVWRNNPLLFAAFRRVILEKYPGIQIVLPRVEPVLGVLAQHIYHETGSFTERDLGRLLAAYPGFAFDINADKEE